MHEATLIVDQYNDERRTRDGSTEPGESAAGENRDLVNKQSCYCCLERASKQTRKANHDHLTARNATCVSKPPSLSKGR